MLNEGMAMVSAASVDATSCGVERVVLQKIPQSLGVCGPDQHYRSLSRDVLRVWQIENLVGTLGATAVVVAIFHGPFSDASWRAWEILAFGVIAVSMLLESLILIPRRHRFYRYALLKDCIVILRGRLFVRQAVFPLHQVLYLHTRQGPILRRYGLVKIHVGTIAEPHSVGPLSMEAVREFQLAVKVRGESL